MSQWPVNLVTAFGRGETLALSLLENGFNVQVIDFTEALQTNAHQGAGPFPIVIQDRVASQRAFIEATKQIPRGICFWLKNGPIELSGPMFEFYANSNPAVESLKLDREASDFEADWLRRYVGHWASPYARENWQRASSNSAFPWNSRLGLIPATQGNRVLSFERYQTMDGPYASAHSISDVQSEGGRLTELEVDGGGKKAWRALQWVWCLSSSETEQIAPTVYDRIFTRQVRRPEWRWISFQGSAQRGTWSQGFPEYSVVIGDVHLPWLYANHFIMRWLDVDQFQLWMKVPQSSFENPEKREEWASEAAQHLNQRLPLAAFRVSAEDWAVCPHSLVFAPQSEGENLPGWRNWDWIAPETLNRLDFQARLEMETTCYSRLTQWRNEQIKKQGARPGDHPLHAP